MPPLSCIQMGYQGKGDCCGTEIVERSRESVNRSAAVCDAKAPAYG